MPRSRVPWPLALLQGFLQGGSSTSLLRPGLATPKTTPPPDPCSSSNLKSVEEEETSISRYESERGTHGRGTPPVMEAGRPRLDELFRQLQLQQVREKERERVGGGRWEQRDVEQCSWPWAVNFYVNIVCFAYMLDWD